AGPRQAPRRIARRLPDARRGDRTGRGILPASAGVTGLRPQRAGRASLPLSRLEGALSGARARVATRAAGTDLRQEAAGRFLSREGGRRPDLDLHGTARARASVPELPLAQLAAGAASRRQDAPGDELFAGC